MDREREPGTDWPTDPNDAEENERWLQAVLHLTPEARAAIDEAEARGDVAEVNRLLGVASACARARLSLAERGAAA